MCFEWGGGVDLRALHLHINSTIVQYRLQKHQLEEEKMEDTSMNMFLLYNLKKKSLAPNTYSQNNRNHAILDDSRRITYHSLLVPAATPVSLIIML